MSKRKTIADRPNFDRFIISLASFVLGISVLSFLVAVDRPHWFIESSQVSEKVSPRIPFERPAVSMGSQGQFAQN